MRSERGYVEFWPHHRLDLPHGNTRPEETLQQMAQARAEETCRGVCWLRGARGVGHRHCCLQLSRRRRHCSRCSRCMLSDRSVERVVVRRQIQRWVVAERGELLERQVELAVALARLRLQILHLRAEVVRRRRVAVRRCLFELTLVRYGVGAWGLKHWDSGGREEGRGGKEVTRSIGIKRDKHRPGGRAAYWQRLLA